MLVAVSFRTAGLPGVKTPSQFENYNLPHLDAVTDDELKVFQFDLLKLDFKQRATAAESLANSELANKRRPN